MSEPTALTRGMILILVALNKSPGHGYAIMMEIERMTSGDYSVSAGTLYRSIVQMLNNELVQEAPELFDPEHDDERRKYYRITTKGKEMLSEEIERMRKLVEVALR